MARARTIKPHFLRSRSMQNVSRDARLTFVHLWLAADDAGRVMAHPASLHLRVFPRDDEAQRLLPGWLAELEREHCIERYVVDGIDYLRVVNWRKHQKIYHPTPSQLPARPVSRATPETLGNEDDEASSGRDTGGASANSERLMTVMNRSDKSARKAPGPASPRPFPSDSGGSGFFKRIAAGVQRTLARG